MKYKISYIILFELNLCLSVLEHPSDYLNHFIYLYGEDRYKIQQCINLTIVYNGKYFMEI